MCCWATEVVYQIKICEFEWRQHHSFVLFNDNGPMKRKRRPYVIVIMAFMQSAQTRTGVHDQLKYSQRNKNRVIWYNDQLIISQHRLFNQKDLPITKVPHQYRLIFVRTLNGVSFHSIRFYQNQNIGIP